MDGERQQQKSGRQVLQRQSAARVHVRAVTLLVQGAGADGEQADEHCEVGAGAGAVARADALVDRERDSREPEPEPEPLQRTDRLSEESEPEERRDDRHRADDERDETDIHAAVRRQIQGAQLHGERQGAHHGAVQCRARGGPRRCAQLREYGQDQPRPAETQHEQRERCAVIERDSGRRKAGAPQNHERDTEQSRRHARAREGSGGRRGRALGLRLRLQAHCLSVRIALDAINRIKCK